MIILDKPFVSEEMKEYIDEAQVSVASNATALRENKGHRFNLKEKEDLINRIQEGERIYTLSENSLEWIYKNVEDRELIRCIDIMKNKVEFRKVISRLYPDFFFREVLMDELKGVDFSTLPLPMILKPAIGFFSVGVYTIRSKNDWVEALLTIEQQAKTWGEEYPDSVVNNTTFILEQYIQGEEYAIDAYYDKSGSVVILNIMKHDFGSDVDVSDRLYYTSAEIVRNQIKPFADYLNQVNQVIRAKNFPVHVEVRVDNERISPIEFNPMRFAGWCCTDLTFFAFGFKTYEYYLNDKKPDWDVLLAGKNEKLFTLMVLDKPENFNDTQSFDYEKLCEKFENVLCIRRVDYRKFPTFGFLFTETTNSKELDYIVKADLSEFIIE